MTTNRPLSQPAVTTEMVAAHGLTPEEFEMIRIVLGRDPNFTELGIFSVMWSEHCSYKNSILQLKTLPRDGDRLLAKAGEENAGAIALSDELAVVFKIESHNHPSAVEPYQGAATGVGGIMRDIFTMGARPVACLNSLRFGSPENPRVRYLLDGVVRGIGDYGNSFGVPTVGGELFFDPSYTGNPLVNAMSVGLVHPRKMARAIASGTGNPIMIVGARTGRDGIHGATFASEEISEKSESKRPSVQIGDPFMEKLLLEATLEIIDEDLIVGIQDMGAAGLTCSSSEMSAKGECGIQIDIEKVPVREERMTPYEVLLSESQERMLVCVKKGNEARVKEIFDKWDLDSSVIGEVTGDKMLTVRYHGEVVARIPSESLVLGGGAPVYRREATRPASLDARQKLDSAQLPVQQNWNELLLRMVGSPNLCHRQWVFEQYDSMVQTNTAVGPGTDAAVLRIRGTRQALAMATDCNSRYVFLNPRRGGAIAVAEAARNIVCSGGKPLAITNCLNFGNPYKPEIYYQFSEAIAGMGDACRAFNTPVTGGNVSFYNEDPSQAVFPTPTIGMVGLIDDIDHITTHGFRDDGDSILLIGETYDELGGSEYLSLVFNQTAGNPPELDLAVERRMQDTLLHAIRQGLVKSAHDLSDGGIAVALSESCLADENKPIGARVSLTSNLRPDALLFGESQSRVIVTVSPERKDALLALIRSRHVPVQEIGSVGGTRLVIEGLIDLPLEPLAESYFRSLARLMERVA